MDEISKLLPPALSVTLISGVVAYWIAARNINYKRRIESMRTFMGMTRQAQARWRKDISGDDTSIGKAEQIATIAMFNVMAKEFRFLRIPSRIVLMRIEKVYSGSSTEVHKTASNTLSSINKTWVKTGNDKVKEL